MKNVKKYILENGGITLDKDNAILQAKKGYMVSLYDTENTTNDIDKVIELIINKQNTLKANEYVGVWFNELNGLYYVDTSVLVTDKDKAVKLAKENIQKAIYDLKNNDSIYLDYNIKFYTLYDKNMNFIKQFDNSQALANFLGKTKRQIEKSLNTNKILDTVGYIFSDTISIQEL